MIVSGEKSGVNDHVDENPEEINNEQWITSAMKWDNNDDGLVFINVGQLENIQLTISDYCEIFNEIRRMRTLFDVDHKPYLKQYSIQQSDKPRNHNS